MRLSKLFAVVVLALAGSNLTAQVVIDYDGTVGTNSFTAYPFSATNRVVQTFWTPADLGNTVGTITQFGLQFVNPVNRTWNNVEIRMGESTNNSSNWSTTYAANYNAAAAVTVFSGNLTVVTTTANELWRVNLTTPFFYSGANNLVVEIRVPIASTGTGTISHVVRFSQTPTLPQLRMNGTPLTATVGTLQQNLAYGASFNFVVGPGI